MTGLLIHAALAALLLLAPVLGLLPIIREGEDNRNFAWGITLQPRDHPNMGIQCYEGVVAQEIVEWYLRWLVALPLAAPAAWLLGDVPGLSIVLAFLVAMLWPRVRVLQREFEYLGHAAEVEVALRLGWSEDYPLWEARGMRTGYGATFRDLSVERIVAAMEARRPLARALLWLLRRRIGRAAR